MFRFIELKKEEFFDPLTLNRDTLFTQSNFYADWQNFAKREVRRFIVKDGEDILAFMQTITYPLIFGKKYVYIPYGPILKNDSSELIKFILENLKKSFDKEVVFIRADFFPTLNNPVLGMNKVPTFSLKAAAIQPRQDWVLDLQDDEQKILDGMYKNTRYSIRLSEKKGVTAEIISNNVTQYFGDFFRLMRETSKRNGFSLHSENYYKMIFESIEKNNNGFLILAKHDGKIVVAELFVRYGDIVTYLFAGSDTESRAVCPSYLAQWTAIKYSKSIGAKTYNFGGVEFDDKNDWAGLSAFKKRFGGYLVTHSELYDIVKDKFWYYAYIIRGMVKK